MLMFSYKSSKATFASDCAREYDLEVSVVAACGHSTLNWA